jgi:hypothetical protein
MIQILANSTQTFIYLDIYDKMTNTDYKPLFNFKSQESKNSQNVVPYTVDYSQKERYVKCSVTAGGGVFPSLGMFEAGSIDYPFGMYNTTIYQNTSDTNYDPTGLTVIWNGLSNIYAATTNPAVEYTEYVENDSEVESIYITNEQ